MKGLAAPSQSGSGGPFKEFLRFVMIASSIENHRCKHAISHPCLVKIRWMKPDTNQVFDGMKEEWTINGNKVVENEL